MPAGADFERLAGNWILRRIGSGRGLPRWFSLELDWPALSFPRAGEVGFYDVGYPTPAGPVFHDNQAWLFHGAYSGAHSLATGSRFETLEGVIARFKDPARAVEWPPKECLNCGQLPPPEWRILPLKMRNYSRFSLTLFAGPQHALGDQAGHHLVRRDRVDAQFMAQHLHRRKLVARSELPADDRLPPGVTHLLRHREPGLQFDRERQPYSSRTNPDGTTSRFAK